MVANIMEMLEKFWLVLLTFIGTSALAAIGARIVIPYIKSISEGVTRIEKEVKMNGADQMAMMHLSKDPMFKADAKGLYTYVNKAYMTLTGMHHADCMGDGWAKAIAGTDRERVFNEWKRCIISGTEFSINFGWVNQHTGSVTRSTCNATITRVDKEAVGSVGVIEIYT